MRLVARRKQGRVTCCAADEEARFIVFKLEPEPQIAQCTHRTALNNIITCYIHHDNGSFTA
jgi:hypothetical protein